MGESNSVPPWGDSAMRLTRVLLAALLWAGAASTASAQSSGRGSRDYYGPYSVYGPGLTYKQPSYYYGPYSAYGPGLTGRRSSSVSVPTFTTLRASSSVVVPDGGEALVAGHSSVSEGRNEFGVPVLGKVPYLDRGYRNVG